MLPSCWSWRDSSGGNAECPHALTMLAAVGWAQTEAEAQAAWTEALRADNRVEALRKVIADYPETTVAPSGLSFLSRLDPPNNERYLR